MKSYRAKFYLMALVLFFTSTVNAGIINTNNDTFIDESTGLEWMDFVINNHYTFNEVSSLLGKGSEYDGWRLATETEALDLWYNAFRFDSPLAHVYFPLDYRRDGLDNNYYLIGYYSNFRKSYNPIVYRSVWDDVFDVMGFNISIREGSTLTASGLFLTDKGNISVLSYQNKSKLTEPNVRDSIVAFGAMNQINTIREIANSGHSTMLIKVPEPSTLAIFALGMVGLVSRRFKK